MKSFRATVDGGTKISGYIVEKYWHLNRHRYVFYRYILESYCEQYFTNSCLMLDAGCGARICSLSHVPKNTSIIGIDLRYQNVFQSHQKAKSLGHKNFIFVAASITSLPFKDGTFDLVVLCDVLEHLKNKHKAITEISRACKSKAGLVGSTSNLLNPIMQFDSWSPKSVTKVLTKKFAGENYERVSRFTPDSLSHALQHGGFSISNIALVGFPPFQPWLYEFSDKRPPWYALLWVIFDKLTYRKPLRFLKETMVFYGIKRAAILSD